MRHLAAEMWFGILFTVLVERLDVKVRSSGISLFLFVMNNVASAGQLGVTPLKSLLGLRAALYVTYSGFYGLSKCDTINQPCCRCMLACSLTP